jgi:hypothetical protein
MTDESMPVTQIPAGKELQKQYPALYRMVDAMRTEADIHASAPNGGLDIYGIMDSILSADVDITDADALFGLQEIGGMSTKDFIDIPFRLSADNIRWMRSTITSSPFPFYAQFDVVTVEGDQAVAVNGGGLTFCSMLWKLTDVGYFDQFPDKTASLVIKGKSTTAGNTVLILKPWGVAPKPRSGGKRSTGGTE